MIDTVVFDLDDTLCEYRRSGADLLSLAFDRVGVEPCFTVEDYYAAFDTHAAPGETVDDIRTRCFASLTGAAGHDPALGRRLAGIYREERDHRDVRFRPGASEALDRLGRDHRLGLVTNGGPAMQRQKLDAIGITDAFDTMVFAGYESKPKPAPEPFHRALDALAVDRDRAVHVGNSLTADVAGAHAAGLRSAWVPTGHPPETAGPAPHYELDSLRDLQDPPWRSATGKPGSRP